ncbi:PoNe immunity protein domain-containing protein [Pseudomonas sp. NPDC096917]|uniref:PoNi-like cognate immunity protein n=1 Tax=Pseudomonas sp. NPDC096917 TaxID=3364483 RepID=UPI00383B4792
MKNFEEIKREPLLQEKNYLEDIAYLKEQYVGRKADEVIAGKQSEGHKKRVSWGFCYESLELLIELYSGGESLESLIPYADHAFSQFERHKKAFPEFSLKPWEPDAYQYILWLLSLAVLFNMPNRIQQIASWISTDSDDGQDVLLRRLFARVGIALPGDKLIHEKPYGELLSALNTRGDEQQQAVRTYLKQWYRGMRNCYWHDRHKRRADAGFFGYWAFEAGLVTLLWEVDDTPYRDLPYYPKDLVDDARVRHVLRSFPEGHRLETSSGLRAMSGEACPVSGVWICDDWPVGPQTFGEGLILPSDNGRVVTWRLVKGISA